MYRKIAFFENFIRIYPWLLLTIPLRKWWNFMISIYHFQCNNVPFMLVFQWKIQRNWKKLIRTDGVTWHHLYCCMCTIRAISLLSTNVLFCVIVNNWFTYSFHSLASNCPLNFVHYKNGIDLLLAMDQMTHDILYAQFIPKSERK